MAVSETWRSQGGNDENCREQDLNL
ncbi:MAG: hypothetical protein J07HB67_02673, partial [halophilic archaeon J07HB67]